MNWARLLLAWRRREVEPKPVRHISAQAEVAKNAQRLADWRAEIALQKLRRRFEEVLKEHGQ